MTNGPARRLAWVAAGLAALASLAFAFAIPAHVEDGWEYRGFFVAVAVAEMAVAIVLAALASGMARSPRVGHAIASYGAVVAAASVAVYFLTLVTGVQHAGHSPEVVAAGPAPLDLVTKAVEVALVGVLVRLAVLTSGDDARAVSAA